MGDIVAAAVLRNDEFEIEIVSINFRFVNFVPPSKRKLFSSSLLLDFSAARRLTLEHQG
jgi:hypothetical protein